MTAFFVPSVTAFSNYDALVAGLNEWLDRADLDANAQEMIGLAEDEMIARLEPLFGEITSSVTVTDGLGLLPNDYGTLVRAAYNGCSLTQITGYAGQDIPAGTTPLHYSIEANRLRLWPETTAAIDIVYRPCLERLTESQSTNALLDKFPSIYFFGAITLANVFVADDARAREFRMLFENAMQNANKYFTRQRFGGPLIPRVVGLR